MRIKLGLLDSNTDYLRKMSDYLMRGYSDKLSVFQFTNPESAAKGIDDNNVDILVASPEFENLLLSIRTSCIIAYFSESLGTKELNGKPAVCKYQKYDDFYRCILDIYADFGPRSAIDTGNGACRIVIFSSPCGGTGTSCMAAAFAMRAASSGKKVLYMNLERLGDSEVFFKSDGYSGMSDIVYAVKLGKSNLKLKFESVKRIDPSGVSFFPSSGNALDTAELTEEESAYLISELRASGTADIIVIDRDFSMSEGNLRVLNEADASVWVSDGTETSISKVSRAISALKIIEKQKGSFILGRTYLMYNKCSSKLGNTIVDDAVTTLGGSPRFEHASVKTIVNGLSTDKAAEMFDKLISILEG